MQEFSNKILCGDCIDLLKGREPFADLIFADPPFNIGYKYDKYHDKKKKEQYISWSRDWISACCDILKPNGSLYIAIGDDYAAYMRIIGDELGLTLRNWIVWHYTFGQQTKAKFARSHTHIFYFVKDKDNYKFNDHAIRVPSDRQLIYNDKRANPQGKLPDDTWNEYSRVCGTFNERVQWHPCQMPESLLCRIIAASSDKDDLVFDPFVGSGTTVAAALKMGRQYCGIDISENYAENVEKRLESVRKEILSHDDIFNYDEILEIERLCSDMGMLPKEIAENAKLLGVFVTQLNQRSKCEKSYDTDKVVLALKKL